VYLDGRGAAGVVRLQVSRPPSSPSDGEGKGGAAPGGDPAGPSVEVSQPEVTGARAHAQDFISPRRLAPLGVIRNRRLQK
jgi:hypothetical protein